jgi:hypothetical protein
MKGNGRMDSSMVLVSKKKRMSPNTSDSGPKAKRMEKARLKDKVKSILKAIF